MCPLTRRDFLATASAIAGSLPFARRLGIGQSAQVESDALTLWYIRPATQWVDALPIGNGRLGAMVYGGGPTNPAADPIDAADPEAERRSGPLSMDPAKETLQVNE